jgi:PncC family amidohydrolase
MRSPPSIIQLQRQAKKVVGKLRARKGKLVLAESCTGGLLASLLTEIPNVSESFCGSEVVYREDSKRAWLGVDAATIRRKSAVSREVSEAMVRGVLRKTREATIAGSITGYLGPSGNDVGLVYFSVFRRGDARPTTLKLEIGAVRGSAGKARIHRRAIAAGKFFELLFALLNSN